MIYMYMRAFTHMCGGFTLIKVHPVVNEQTCAIKGLDE